VQLESPVAGDICANAIPLTLTSGAATHTGTTGDATDDYTASCGGAYADKVHSFTITAPSRLSLAVTRTTSSGTSPMVSLRTTCGAASSQLSCRGWSEPQPVIGYALPGTYYAIVDSIFSSTGPYKLDVTTATPWPGESCENAESLTLGTTITDSTAGYGHDMGSGTFGYDGQGPDRVYKFTETTSSTRTVTFTTPSFGWTGSVFVQAAPCMRERTGIVRIDNKNDGKPVSRTFASTAGTTYFVVVDTQGTVTSGGSYTLRVE
jgi:hypothetical protein